MKNFISIIIFLVSFSINAEEQVTKKYYVKGMTCGGCILGVKVALKKEARLNIKKQDISVGIAELSFLKDEYKKDKTDCTVTKAVEKYTEFSVYLDEKFEKKACN